MPSARTVQTEQGASLGQRWNASVFPSGDQSGWSSTTPLGGCVICRSPVPSGLIGEQRAVLLRGVEVAPEREPPGGQVGGRRRARLRGAGRVAGGAAAGGEQGGAERGGGDEV